MKEDFAEVTRGVFKRLGDPANTGGAAELAFWLLLSLAPAMIVIAQILQVFTSSIAALHIVFETYVAEEIYILIGPLLDYNPHISVTILLSVLAVTAGSNATYSLMKTKNRIFRMAETSKNWRAWVVKERLYAMFSTLIVLVAVYFAFYILVYGEIMLRAALSYNNVFLGVEMTVTSIWYDLRWIIAFALFFLMAIVIYNILPYIDTRISPAKWFKDRRVDFRNSLPGVLFTAIAMLVVTLVFTQFIRYFVSGNINILYGSLSSMVMLLLWFYTVSFVVVVGIHINALNAEIRNRRESDQVER